MSKTEDGKLHLTDQMQPNPLVEIVSVSAFPLKQQICVAATEISWLKVLLSGLLQEKFANTRLEYLIRLRFHFPSSVLLFGDFTLPNWLRSKKKQ